MAGRRPGLDEGEEKPPRIQFQQHQGERRTLLRIRSLEDGKGDIEMNQTVSLVTLQIADNHLVALHRLLQQAANGSRRFAG